MANNQTCDQKEIKMITVEDILRINTDKTTDNVKHMTPQTIASIAFSWFRNLSTTLRFVKETAYER